ncbi:DEAD/DEAH box helicase [Serratia nematodiphila]
MPAAGDGPPGVGDVGFGKTEVAMRAAFLAVENGKQVAVLVPTTLLAQQHFDNFRESLRHLADPHRDDCRASAAPKSSSRCWTTRLRAKWTSLSAPHKLLQSDLRWKDLGLLIRR